MNYTSMQMQDTLRRLEATLPEATPEQRRLLDELNAQIEENGRYYVVESLTVEQMREHGYDLTEEDGRPDREDRRKGRGRCRHAVVGRRNLGRDLQCQTK